jgi:hypothetical protein
MMQNSSTVGSDKFNRHVQSYSGQNVQPNGEPGLGLLQRCAQNIIVRAIGNPVLKVTGGLMFGIAMMKDNPDDQSRIVAIVGASIWLASTLASTARNPTLSQLADHLSSSVGYAVGGIVLLPLLWCTKGCCSDGTDQETDDLTNQYSRLAGDGKDRRTERQQGIDIERDSRPTSLNNVLVFQTRQRDVSGV